MRRTDNKKALSDSQITLFKNLQNNILEINLSKL